MVSIKTVADGLSKQIEQAIEGKANVEQANVLCKSVDSLVKLARLQIEMASIDWSGSDERPVIEMEKASAKLAGDGPAKALTATALMTTPTSAKSLPLGDRLMSMIYVTPKSFTARDIAEKIGALKEVEAVIQNLAYWTSKDHLAKAGTGAMASYAVVDREFFKPKAA